MLFAAALFGLGLSAAAAPQQGDVQSTSPAALASAFRSICLEHIGDTNAQRSAALAPPWTFVADAAEPGPEKRYRRDGAMLSLSPDRKACLLTVLLSPTETLQSVQGAVSETATINNWQPLLRAGGSYSLIAPNDSDEEFVVAIYVSSDSHLATISVEKRQKKS